jgi:hypothetical protein
MRAVLGSLNKQIDQGIEQIKANEIEPVDLETGIRGQMIQALSENPDIDPKDWGAISALVTGRVNEASKTHYVSQDGTNYVFDAFGGFQVLGVDSAEIDEKAAFFASFGTKSGPLIATYFNKLPEGEQQRIISDFAELHINSEVAKMGNVITENKMKAINLGIKQKELAREEIKVNYDSDLTTFLEETATRLFSQEGNPEDASALLEARFIQFVSEDTDFASAGFTDSAQVISTYKPILDGYKELFRTQSQFGKDSFEAKRKKTEVDLDVLNFIGELDTDTKIAFKTGQGMMNAVSNRILLSSSLVGDDIREAVKLADNENKAALRERVSSGNWGAIGKRTFKMLDQFNNGKIPDAVELHNSIKVMLDNPEQYDEEVIKALQERWKVLLQNPGVAEAFKVIESGQ